MKKNLTPAGGHTVCLSVLLLVLSAAVIAAKAFFPAFILPRITITVLTALSLASILLEHWIFRSTGTPEYLETGLLTMAAFAVLTWALGLADLSGAGKVGIAGGIVYDVCLLVFSAMEAQLESADIRRKGAALTLGALLLLLASQSLAGIPVL